MNAQSAPSIDPFRAYLDAHLDSLTSPRTNVVRPVVTLSREAGTGAKAIAEKVARHLEQAMHQKSGAWSAFHENLAEKVLEAHDLPQRLAKYMPEGRINHIQGMIEEFVGLHPSQWTLVQHTAETMLYLAELGNVILVGRGGVIVTHTLKHTFHVRLIGSKNHRLQRLMDAHGLGRKEALELMRERDDGRRSYVRTHFQKDVEDPHLYDLVINTDRLDSNGVSRLISEQVLERFGSAMLGAA